MKNNHLYYFPTWYMVVSWWRQWMSPVMLLTMRMAYRCEKALCPPPRRQVRSWIIPWKIARNSHKNKIQWTDSHMYGLPQECATGKSFTIFTILPYRLSGADGIHQNFVIKHPGINICWIWTWTFFNLCLNKLVQLRNNIYLFEKRIN